jgi:hypothetical protein
MHKLTNKQILILAVIDNSFQVDPDLKSALAAVKKEVDQWVCDSYNFSGLLFDPAVQIPAIVDKVLAERKDICMYCGCDCTDLRVGFNCHQCGGN